jgi:hypothetical protein
MSICGNNKALDDLKAKQLELDGLLGGGKDLLGDMEAKLNAMKADLESFKPELPQVDSLQSMLSDLTGLTNPLDKAASIAELKLKFGEALDIDGLLAELGLDDIFSFEKPDICALVPNVEASADGTVKEQPTEPKVPEEPPVAEEPVELSPSDLEYGNKRVLQRALKRANGTLKNLIHLQIGPLIGSKKKAIEIMSIIYPEFHKSIAESNGTTFDELKYFDYTEAEWQNKKAGVLEKYPDAEPYIGTFVDLVRERFDEFLDDGIVTTFDEACTQAVARQQAKIANTSTQEV